MQTEEFQRKGQDLYNLIEVHSEYGQEFAKKEEEARTHLKQKYNANTTTQYKKPFLLQTKAIISEFAKSEYTDEMLQETPMQFEKAFDYVLDGEEREYVNRFVKFWNYEPLPNKKPLSLHIPRIKTAIQELSKFGKQSLQTANKNMLFLLEDANLKSSESELHVVFSLTYVPKWNQFFRPISIPLSHPIHGSGSDDTTVDVLILVANRQRKEYFASLSIHAKLFRVDKLNTLKEDTEFFDSFDLIFVDAEVSHSIYQKVSHFNHMKNHLIVFENDQEIVSKIKEYKNGTQLFYARGSQPVSVPFGYIQWSVDANVKNVTQVIQSVSPYLQMHDNDIVRVYIKTNHSPALPIYFNPKALDHRFKLCKQFAHKE